MTPASHQPLNTPVLIIIFNRPAFTRKMVEALRVVKPLHLFVAADGPRTSDDVEKCMKARDELKSVDWECTIKKVFSETNKGCRLGVSSSITWFFQQVEEGIILEDDCIPHSDFFYFAESMIVRYRDNPQVMHITAGNYQFGTKRGEASYYASRIAHIWGWATWRRAWAHYDLDMNDFPSFLSKNKEQSFFPNPKFEKYWLFFFNRAFRETRTWDYQWVYAIMKNQGICIVPNINMITNVGFGKEATYTKDVHPLFSNCKSYPMPLITHPSTLYPDEEADQYTITYAFGKLSLTTLLKKWWNARKEKKNFENSRKVKSSMMKN